LISGGWSCDSLSCDQATPAGLSAKTDNINPSAKTN